MRLDRFISLNLVHPLRQAWSSPGAGCRVPVLMYHNVSDDPELGVSAYYKTNTSPAVFRQHMQFLADHDYQTISLQTLIESLCTGSVSDSSLRGRQCAVRTPMRAVALTFDDAFQSVYTEAFPVLQQHGFTAAVFLPTAFIGDTRRQFAPRKHGDGRPVLRAGGTASLDCLTWSEVHELRRHGIEFGSHTANHPELVRLSWPEIKTELADSKAEIEQRLGEPVKSFCYPFAFPQTDRSFTHTLRGLLMETGYECCLTTQLGTAQPGDDPFSIKRLPANSLDDESLFLAKLAGAYDWLAWPQRTAKRIASVLKPRRQPSAMPATGCGAA